MSKHTPGPWEFNGKRTWDVIDQVGFSVATIAFRRLESAEASANARLIAAAPELLEALQAAKPLLEMTLPDGDHITHFRYAIGLAKSAIAKATGETK